jgi:hypothetical protein
VGGGIGEDRLHLRLVEAAQDGHHQVGGAVPLEARTRSRTARTAGRAGQVACRRTRRTGVDLVETGRDQTLETGRVLELGPLRAGR